MDKKTITKFIKNSLFLLLPNQDKIELIDDNTIDLSTKIKLLKSLDSYNKTKVLNNIYGNKNISFTEEELIHIYKSLSYQNKLLLQSILSSEDKYKYLKYLSKSEINRIITKTDLGIEARVYIIDNMLTQKQRENLYKYSYLSSNEIIAVIKHFDEEKRRKIILKKQGQISRLSESEYIQTLSYLPTIKEKLIYLDDNNKYNIKLSLTQKVKLIISTNDKTKIKFIKENKIDPYLLIEIFKSLSDTGKLHFINKRKELKKLSYLIDSFFESFSEELASEVLKNKIQYLYEDERDILISRLSPLEKLQYLKKYNLKHICKIDSILLNLPEEYKLELLKPNNIYDIYLNQNELVLVAKSLKLINLIEVLIKNPQKYVNFEQKDIWVIIESISSEEAIILLKQNDENIKSFINKYKTSISKCLDDHDKVDILFNRSKYDIYLEDNRKLKLLKTIYTKNTPELFEDNVFKYFEDPQKVIDKLMNDINLFNKLDIRLKEKLIEFYTGKKANPEFINICINIIKFTNNPKEIIENFDEFQLLFNKLNINLLDFIQYGINSNKYKWDEMIINIIKNNKFEEFYNIKNYFFNNYYLQDNHKKKTIENFLEILNAYTKYETLCKHLANENKILTELDKSEIRYLFNSDQKIKPENIEDIKKIRNDKIKCYHDVAKKSNSIYGIKLMLLQLFFNKDVHMLKDMLYKTGGVQELNILKFNNKDNPEYTKIIDHVILMTEFIEKIIITEDLVGLKEMIIKYTSEDNLKETKKYINYFSKYEEYIRKIYELDVQISLTNIDTLDDSFTKTDKAIALAKQYGGKVIDLSESQYVLIGHVKNERENIDNLLLGKSDGNSNFICTSPVSHRGQHYYSYFSPYDTVFAYDHIPKDSFICSSTENLGSNHILRRNTSEVPEFRRAQKGILETSEAALHRNAEMLLYREGMKPCGIIIPTDESISKEAIEYHQKYNLPFIITQGIDTTIENPKKITNQTKKINTNEFNNIEVPTDLINDNKNERKIAILTDPHALYEPTMACLTDIKNRGITEIYSLGDNIGHGPSPKETLDLLKQHNVKSILGNHELYVIEDDSMEIFKEHLEATNALERTTEMTNWTKEELTKEQLQELKEYKDKYELITPNGKKITLIHTTEPYNKKGKYSNPIITNDSDMIIQGHIHFENQQNNNYILRAVGIGQTEKDDGKASYAILTIKKDNCNLKIQNIPYNRSNLLHTINESSMPVKTKKLIEKWVGNHII